jgi:hypothetical protein
MKILILFTVVVFSACSAGKQSAPVSLEKETMQNLKYSPVTVIDRRNLDGCDFMLQMTDSSFLEPINLPDSVRINGLKLWLLFHTAKDRVSICMSGKIIIIDDLKVRNK